MKKLEKTAVCGLLGIGLILGATGCKNDDPDYDGVNPPAVAAVQKISGRITGMDGEGIQATVTMDGTESTQTDTDGIFVIEGVAAGAHSLKAEANGKMAKEGSVTVEEKENGQSCIWNVALSNAGTEVEVEADGSVTMTVVSETLKGNESARVEVELKGSEGSVPAGNSLTVTLLYSLEDVEAVTKAAGSLRASESIFLIGTQLSSSDPSAVPEQPVRLEYKIDEKIAANITARKYVSGQWTDADFTVEGGQVIVLADRFASYALLFEATVTSSVASEAIAFTPASWDNLYGRKDLTVTSTSYTYKIGTEMNPSGTDPVSAYLKEILARRAGTTVTTVTDSYPLDVTLPVGTAMEISGRQSVLTWTISAVGKTVSGKQYGDVSIFARTWNRNHTGGSN